MFPDDTWGEKRTYRGSVQENVIVITDIFRLIPVHLCNPKSH